ncbi:TrkA C-terminal domain-containing protein [Actinoplanes sp. NPDC049316]|uniref:cation:proton antiporter regulatory subunit n=1 Tax=Actinoplanes sp. NPDC049316 TaxID=3154727 RepID=UPI0034254722
MNIERTALPGVGVRHTADTTAGQRFGVITHLDGCRDVVVYDPGDPDDVAYTLHLDPAEAHSVADLLDATVTIDHIRELEQRIDGVTAARIRVPVGSPYDGCPLADARAGTPAGTAIVAVIRGSRVTAAPGPEFLLRHDDTVVAVGDHRGIAVLTAGLSGGESVGP